jgi:hypothetical protein
MTIYDNYTKFINNNIIGYYIINHMSDSDISIMACYDNTTNNSDSDNNKQETHLDDSHKPEVLLDESYKEELLKTQRLNKALFLKLKKYKNIINQLEYEIKIISGVNIKLATDIKQLKSTDIKLIKSNESDQSQTNKSVFISN